MDISSESEDEEDSDDNLAQVQEQATKSKKKKAKYIEGEKIIQEYAQEVDYESFEKKFWPKYCYRERHLTPAAVWTEIFSVIKGSHNSCEFPLKGIPKDVYINSSSKRSTISNDERKTIYSYYERYEMWKRDFKGFDFMDLVNHILREL